MRMGLFLLLATPLLADISGFVRDEGGMPLESARVRVQTELGDPVLTAADGSFTLTLSGGTNLRVTAAITYDPDRAVNYVSASTIADDGDTGVVISLPAIPDEDNTGYFPIKARTPDGCGDCHAMQLAEWELSRHADTAENTWVTYVFAAWSAQNPGQTGFCASCHAPAADSQDPGNIFLDQLNSLPVLDRLSAKEGVNCSSCHQMDHVNDNFAALHLNGNATMRFPLDGVGGLGTHEYVWGPLDDVSYPFMKSVYNPQFQESELCASCHEYNNPFNELPAQTTYSEWLASDFGNQASGSYATCQDCHMSRGITPAELCDPPPGFGNGPMRPASSHGNHTIQGTTQAGLADSVELTSTVDVVNGRLNIGVSVANTGAGHAFPTGISIRNVLLRVVATGTSGQNLSQTSGSVIPFYGSDNDGVIGEGDWAGLPGRGFAKVLEDAAGNKPVLFIDAVAVSEDTRIQAGETDTSYYDFDIDNSTCNGGTIDINLILTYRRAWRATVTDMGWTVDNRGLPWELELINMPLSFTLQQLGAAMWLEENSAPGFDGNGNGYVDMLDLISLGNCN